MASLHFLILLAIVSSFAGAEAGFATGFRAVPAFKPIGPYYCSTTGNYTFKSPYQVNLIKLMDALQSGAIANRAGFNYAVAGEAPEAVFGLTMCYADRNWTQCQDCLQAATTGVELICPYSRKMKAREDACVLQYSDESFFSLADLTSAFHVSDNNNSITDMAGVNATLWSLMSRLAAEASVSKLRLEKGSQEISPHKDTSMSDICHGGEMAKG